MTFARPNQRSRLVPRCRLVTSRKGIMFQRFGCSPIKVTRELGLERRETVRSLSIRIITKILKNNVSTRGLQSIDMGFYVIYCMQVC